jgi:hypothetical protein
MIKQALVVSAMVILSGCVGQHGLIGQLPEVKQEDKSATLYLLRNNNFFGSGVNLKVTLDTKPIFGISIGDYTKFKVEEGIHTVGVICKGGWSPGTHINEKTFNMKAGEEYYAMARAGGVCAVIEPLTKEEGAKVVASSKYVPVQP